MAVVWATTVLLPMLLWQFAPALIATLDFVGNGDAATSHPAAETGDVPHAEVQSCRVKPLECVTLTVPLDHSEPEGETTTVTFAVHEASGERVGALVIAVGGPGYSATDNAGAYLEWFEPLADDFDLVFFDQRGVALAGDPAECPQASRDFAGMWGVADLADSGDQAIEEARQFAEACSEEIGITAQNAHHFASWQSIHDLEAFRRYIGDEVLYVYGESYGTVVARGYGEAYSDRVGAIVLDGPVDVTQTLQEMAVDRTASFEEVLQLTLDECADDEWCAADFPDDDPVAAYDELASRVGAEGVEFEFTSWNGAATTARLAIDDVRTAAISSMYTEYGRSTFLRSLAAGAQEQFGPLAVLSGKVGWEPTSAYEYFELGPYYAIECADLPGSTGDPEDVAARFLEAGEQAGIPDMRLGALYYDFLVCVYWPKSSVEAPESPSRDSDFPTVILSSTTDPATPHHTARALFEESDDAYLFTVEEGPHGIFPAGDRCVIDPVEDLLADGEPIEDRETECASSIYFYYVPALKESLADYPDPLEAMLAIDDHITLLPQFGSWDLRGTLEVGCDRGGSTSMVSDDEEVEMTFTDCTFLEGLAFEDGSATYDLDTGALAMDVTLPNGALQYERSADFELSLEGTLDGEAIELSE